MSGKPFSGGLTDTQFKGIFISYDDHQIHHRRFGQVQSLQEVRKCMPVLLGSAARKCPNFHEDQHHNPATGQQGEKHATCEAEYVASCPWFKEVRLTCIVLSENGKEIELDTERMKIEDIIQEVDRHSRALNRQAELAGER